MLVEEAEQKDLEEEESASEASKIMSSDNKSSEDECYNVGEIRFTVKRDWEGQVNYYPTNEEYFMDVPPDDEATLTTEQPIEERLSSERF